MKFGVSTFPTADSIQPARLARALEERGFDALFFTEHTHIPASRRTPYFAGGDMPPEYWESYEPFTALAVAAAASERLLIGTAICLVPQHHPLALAKRIATLDHLSGGRFVFGVGGGWLVEELENHGVRFEDRWKLTRESILAMKACWTQKDAEFHGDFVDFDPVWSEPKPVQKPHPPIYIGANSRWGIERVVEFGDGWLPMREAPGFDEGFALLDQVCEERGRDRNEISIMTEDGAESRDHVAELEARGVERINFLLPTLDESAALKHLDSLIPLME